MSSTQDEIAVMAAHTKALSSIPVTYPDDHVPDPEEVDFPKKMVPFPVSSNFIFVEVRCEGMDWVV